MIGEKRMDKLCVLAMALAALIALGLMLAALGQPPAPLPDKGTLGVSQDYADTLFDASYVHCIDLIVPKVNWDYMVAHAVEEQYVLCDAVIDGERIGNVALRPKGNSSLASIAGAGSDRFSFKVEFDHYRAGNTFRGLDKLALNNLGQDITCLKDFLSYRMMVEMGVPGPLCAYTLLRVNGEDFGLYLAVEAVEDSFAARNYGQWTGNLYRPDVYAIQTITPASFMHAGESELFQLDVDTLTPGDRVDAIGPIINLAFADKADLARISAGGYAGEDPDAYRVVFDTAVFRMAPGDQARYIGAVRTLCASDAPLDALDVDALARYFAVHNFVNNYDSYTGVFAHNYYICERDGRLSLVPWDYNLAFGAFSAESAYKCFARDSQYYEPMLMGNAMSADCSFVNYPIDTPLVSARMEDRPIARYLLEDETGLAAYHAACEMLVDAWFSNGRFAQTVADTVAMLRPYVAAGLTFYTPDQFDLAVENLARYGELRARSMAGQLDGTIPATLEGQKADYSTLVDVSGLDLSRTIDFGGLAFGITPEEVCAVLDAVFDGQETADLPALAAELQAEPAKLLALIGRVIRSSKLISGALIGAATGPALLIVCVAALLIALRRLRKGRGPRRCR